MNDAGRAWEDCMRFQLIPRQMQFFDLFNEAAVHLTATAHKFLEMVTVFDKLAERAADMRAEEEALDSIIHRILEALDRSFITPFDREDIHTLVTSLDDVMDNMEETAHRLAIFRIERPAPPA